MKYPIEYAPSFVLFWGVMITFAIISSTDTLMLAVYCMMMLVLVSHEHAHLLECERLGIKVNWVKFTWLGGAVNADLQDPHEAVQVLEAGVVDTTGYALSFIGIIAGVFLIGTVNHWNFADPTGTVQRIQFIYSLASFAIIMTITNVLPIEYRSKKHGLITTDGWAVMLMQEIRDELWNDGKIQANILHKN